MPVKRRLPKARYPRLDNLAEWELAFIEERMTPELRVAGGFCHYFIDCGPDEWMAPDIIARALALWEARNEHRAQDGLPPVWPDNTLGLRKLDATIPAQHPLRFRLEEYQDEEACDGSTKSH